jgi:hypothetical protein
MRKSRNQPTLPKGPTFADHLALRKALAEHERKAIARENRRADEIIALGYDYRRPVLFSRQVIGWPGHPSFEITDFYIP